MRMNSTSVPLCRMPAQGFGGGGGASSVLSSWKSFGALRALPLLLRSIRALLRPVAAGCAVPRLCAVALGETCCKQHG